MRPLLQLLNLRVRREGQTVLDIEALSVERGEVLAIVGPNGAGKSTLFLVLARLLRADEGQVLFDGRPTDSLHDATSACGQFISRRRLQAYAINAAATVNTTTERFENT